MTRCRKIRYASRKAATQMRRRLIGVRNRDKLRAYHCETCDAWHLGNLGGEVRRGERSRAEVYGGAA